MQKSQPEYEVVLLSDVMVPLRDGVRLATDVYLPARNGNAVSEPLPAVMQRTPYDKTVQARRDDAAQYFASRGYAVVFQDTRGRFNSEGKFVKYLTDPEDGFDTCEWVGQQAWSNGKIGTFGISYGAHTQAAMAALDPPNLACMFLDSGGFTNAHDNSCRNGGAFELRQIVWAFNNAKASPEATADPKIREALEAEDLGAWFQRMPWRRGHSPLRWVPEYEDYIFKMWTNGDFDEYWQQPGICNEMFFEQYSPVPQMHFGSWYDPYTKTTTKNFTGLSPIKQGPVRLVLGPWTHGAHDAAFAGDVDFGHESTVAGSLADDYNDLRLRWFDHWLKGIDNGVADEPPVTLFAMGGGDGHKTEDGRIHHGGNWRQVDEWPPREATHAPYFFHPDGSLSTGRPPSDAQPSAYQFDPNDPVPTVGGNISSGGELIIGGAFDQRAGPRFFGSEAPYLPLSSRHDVLVFQTPPLEEAIEVTGPIDVRLWISSSAVDTDFTAKLVDVHPPSDDFSNGFDMNLCDGIIRARYRDTFDRQDLMTPGEVYELAIELYPTSNLFAAGHRIRIDISSSNFPRLDVNPNTGEPLGQNRRTVVAENTVYHDADRPSHVVLPVMPNRPRQRRPHRFQLQPRPRPRQRLLP